jgi:hypothetical protein
MEQKGTRNPLAASSEEIAKWNEDAARLRAGILAQIEDDYRILVMVLGKEEADRRMRAMTEKSRGRPKGSIKPEQDKFLLNLYDLLVRSPDLPDPIKSLPTRLGMYLHQKNKGEYGNSANAITTKLRRLLKKREARLREQRELGNPLAS